jgi:molybdopterin-containing oxidoreductase family iron-sulfur binding subunit
MGNPVDVRIDKSWTSIDESGDVSIDSDSTISRRSLIHALAGSGAFAFAGALASGGILDILLAQPARASGAKYRYGMVVDTRRCVGCKACVVACKQENKTPPGVYYNVVVEDTRENAQDRPLWMTKPCFHCENPPCIKVCPVSATFKREQDGIVVIDYDRCIGCRYCITACPYSARYFDFGDKYDFAATGQAWANVPSPEYDQYREHQDGVSPVGNVRKCTFCLHLQDENGQYDKAAGRWPACAKTCTGKAIHFGDFNDPNSEVSQLLLEKRSIRLKEELGTEPNVYYLI